ncbi:MAG: right-handed parallel beta-helix repeat-containing protein [bacterium]
MRHKLSLVGLLLLLLGATVALGQMSGTYTIKPSGGDFANHVDAATALRNDGVSGPCTLEMYTGTYTGQAQLSNISTTPTNHIIFKAAAGESPAVTNSSYPWHIYYTNNVTIDGITTTSTSSYGFYVFYSERFTLRNSQVTASSYGVYQYYSDTCKFYNNDIRGSNGIYNYYGGNCDTIVGNFLISSSSYGYYRTGSSSYYANNMLFVNNMMSGTSYGMYLWYANFPTLAYNTVYGGSYGFYGYYLNTPVHYNNIFVTYSTSYAYATWNCTGTPVFDYNCHWSNGTYACVWSGTTGNWTWWQGQGRDLNGINQDPQIASATNLHLRTGSPCIGAATPISGVTTDIDGDTRDGSTPDIGADEWTNPGDPMSGVYTIMQDGNGDFESFNEALDAILLRGQAGDVTFCVYEGVYSEKLIINGFPNGAYKVVFQGLDTLGAPTGATLAAPSGYAVDMRNVKRFEFRHLTVTAPSYVFYWYYLSGSSPYPGVDSCVVADCQIRGTYGFYMYYGDDYNRIERNDIYATSSYGIYMRGQSSSYPSVGNVFASNAVYGWTSYGLYLYYHGGTELYFNTVYGTGSYGFYDYYGYNSQVRQNNIFRGNTYGWYKYFGDAIPTTSDYNCFNSNGTYPIYHSSYGGINLASWRSYSSRDLNSIQADPLVVSTTNLHLLAGSPCRDSGLFLAGHGLDFDRDLRDSITPDIGADEWTYPGDPLAGVYTVGSGGKDFANIAAAVNAAQMRGFAGDVRFDIYSQTHSGMLNLEGMGNGPYHLWFRGVPGENVVINAGTNYGVRLYNNRRVKVEGFNITGFTSYGLYAWYSDSCSFVRNTLSGPNGISWYYSSYDSIIGNNIQATSSYGMYLWGNSSPRSPGNVIANNMVTGWTFTGIYLYYQDNPKVYYNSLANNASGSGSYDFMGGYITSLTSHNNIYYLSNSSYCFFTTSNDGTPSVNYNVYWTNGMYPCVWNNGTGNWAWWQSQGYDANGYNRMPGFNSMSDLHLADTSVCIGAANPTAGFTTDIDGDIRSATAPTIGADEVIGDVALTHILAPGTTVPVGAPFTPRARLALVSGPATTVAARMEIRKAGELVYSGVSNAVLLGTGGVDTVDLSPPCTLAVIGTDYTAAAWHTSSPDRDPSNDSAAVSFVVGNVDMAMLAITAPTAQTVLNTAVNPQVRLVNFGDFPATATVTFQIDNLADGGDAVKVGLSAAGAASIPVGTVAAPVAKGSEASAQSDAIVYNATISSGTIPAGDTVLVTFPTSWNATPAGAYQARAWHVLEFDTDPANDSAELDFMVILPDADVGVAQIIQPGTFVDTNATFTPTARWRNYNTSDPVSFTAYFEIESPTLGWFYAEQVTVNDLAPGMDTVLSFTDVSVGMDTGAWAARCSSYAAGDINPANDAAWRTFVVAARPPFDEGWVEVKPMPLAPSGKAARRGAWLALNPGDGMIYATKGYKTQDFYRYDPIADTWTELASAPADPVKGRPLEKGCRGITDGDNTIYMVHGNNTTAFWQYDIAANAWTPLADVPLGPSGKRVKGGGDLVHVTVADSAYLYFLKGDRLEFYRYDIASGQWQQLADMPVGIRNRVKRDGWLAWDGGNAIYALKPNYFDRANETHEFWQYDIAGDSWLTNAELRLAGMPLWGMHGGRIKRKKAKDGGAGAYDGGLVYAIKGGNTQQFWLYDELADAWTEQDTVPTFGSTGRRRRVNAGADLVGYGGGAFFMLKGNKTVELWRYVVPMGFAARPRLERSGVMSGKSVLPDATLDISPNPVIGGLVTLRCNLPNAEPAVVSVFDITGREVFRQSAIGNRQSAIRLDLRSLSAGIYLVQLEADGFSATRKLVLHR